MTAKTDKLVEEVWKHWKEKYEDRFFSYNPIQLKSAIKHAIEAGRQAIIEEVEKTPFDFNIPVFNKYVKVKLRLCDSNTWQAIKKEVKA